MLLWQRGVFVPDYGKMTLYPIFKGFSEEDIKAFVESACVRNESFSKGDILLHEGDECREMGLILEGNCIGETFTESGRRDIAALLGEGEVFGDVLAMSRGGKSPVTLTAENNVLVMFIPFEKLMSASIKPNNLLLHNLTQIISEKYFSLLFRVNCLSKPTLREKILYYLHEMKQKSGSSTFSVDFNRSQMADFLAADRSALSRELSNLKKEGIIDFYKNTFSIKI